VRREAMSRVCGGVSMARVVLSPEVGLVCSWMPQMRNCAAEFIVEVR